MIINVIAKKYYYNTFGESNAFVYKAVIELISYASPLFKIS